MTLYLTPERFRTMSFGSNLARYDGKDMELASILHRASALADAYCAVPLRPQRHSFLGGSITAEQHPWRLAQTPFESTQRRLYPMHTPIKTCSRFRIYVTQPDPDSDDGQYVQVSPRDLMINRNEDYIEVVSSAMTSTGLFNALIVPAIYLANPICTVDYTYGWDFSVTDEPLYESDALVFQSQNNFWIADTASIYINGNLIDPGDYTLDLVEGTVVFAEAPTLSGTVTASYRHRLPLEIRDAVGHIATHLIEDAGVTSRGLAELQSIEIAGQIKVAKPSEDKGPSPDVGSARAYIDANVPEAGVLLNDFSFWRIA